MFFDFREVLIPVHSRLVDTYTTLPVRTLSHYGFVACVVLVVRAKGDFKAVEISVAKIILVSKEPILRKEVCHYLSFLVEKLNLINLSKSKENPTCCLVDPDLLISTHLLDLPVLYSFVATQLSETEDVVL